MTSYRQSNPIPYTGPVATRENPAAHGNIEVTEYDYPRGRQRRVLINGKHREEGPWVPRVLKTQEGAEN